MNSNVDTLRLSFWRNYLLSVLFSIVIGMVIAIKYTIVAGIISYFIMSFIGMLTIGTIFIKKMDRERD